MSVFKRKQQSEDAEAKLHKPLRGMTRSLYLIPTAGSYQMVKSGMQHHFFPFGSGFSECCRDGRLYTGKAKSQEARPRPVTQQHVVSLSTSCLAVISYFISLVSSWGLV